ncbi:hypothetical protein ACQP1G_28775 [Nocardia sp. CA-107356]|uniref:hypothetical protein n=1 Tax=Nocardia sp. CA-107356 TaxID=3239972 RepID=UPI003D8AAED9
MGIELNVAGVCRAPTEDFLDQVGAWLRTGPAGARVGWTATSAPFRKSVEVSGDRLLAVLHPAAEPVDLRAAHGQVVVSAGCAPAGPGYHRHVAAVLHEMGRRFDIVWDEGTEDPLGLADNRAEVEQDYLVWIRTLAETVLTEVPAEGAWVSIGLSTGSDRFDYDGLAASWLGPRDRDWFHAVADGDEAAARAFFPWWEDGWTAPTIRNTAMGIIWNDVRWRAPSDADDSPALHQADALLAEAYRLDPALALPWAAWHELRLLLADSAPIAAGAPGDLPARAAAEMPPVLGYRRRSVRTTPVSGWSLRIPGEFTYGWDGDRWWAWDGTRQIEITILRVGDAKTGPPPAAMLQYGANATAGHRGEPVVGGPGDGWWLPSEDGEEVGVQGIASRRNGELLLVTISVPGPQLDWAIEAWRSLRYGGD